MIGAFRDATSDVFGEGHAEWPAWLATSRGQCLLLQESVHHKGRLRCEWGGDQEKVGFLTFHQIEISKIINILKYVICKVS